MAKNDREKQLYWDISKHLSNVLDEMGITTTEIAKRANTTQPKISLIRNGSQLPSMTTAVELARALNLSLDELYNPTAKFDKDSYELSVLYNSLSSLAQEDLRRFAKYRVMAQNEKKSLSASKSSVANALKKFDELSSVAKLDVIQFIEYRHSQDQK